MPNFISQLFNASGFMPHGMCFLWRPEILTLHVFADAVIALSYFSIPFFLFTLARKRRDLIYRWVLYLFAAFIFFCGLTHAFGIWTIWNPDYLVEGSIKLATALISATTAIALWPLLPQLLAIPSPVQLKRANLKLKREIRERKQAMGERERSQRFLQTVLENVQDGIVACNAEGTLTLFNPAAREFHSLPEEPVPPERWAEHYDLYLADGKTPMRKEDIPLYRALQGEEVRNVEMVIKPKAGRQRTVLASGQAMFDDQGTKLGAVVTLHDITKRRQAEQQLQLWGKVVEVSSSGVLITDPNQPDNPIISVNPAFERVTGYTAEEVLGSNCRFLQGDERDQPELHRLHTAVREQRDCQVVLRNYRKDGSLFWNELFIAPVRDDNGQVTHFIGIQNDITEYKTYEAQLEHQANHDALTQLANRTLLQDRLNHAIIQAQRAGRRFAVLFLDLDRFKIINDSLGHTVGDTLLQAVATRLKTSVRQGDTVARQGGDEFVIVLEDLPQEELAGEVARKILDALTLPFGVEGQELFVAGSIGISLFPKDGKDTGTLLKHADIAMYRAKEHGGNTVQFYAREMNARLRERLAMENDLRYALERGELELYYQPQVALKTGQVVGVEALLRWCHPQRGMISPAEFIPLAEETGLIIPIGEWVLREACTQVKIWREAGLPAMPVAVNLSARQFLQTRMLTELVDQILKETCLEPPCLELEITESLLMKNVEGTIQTLQTLKDMGVQLAIDDFGTGYSSLSYLKRFPIGRLKIDKSFVRDITTDPDDAAITLAIIAMAHSMKLKVIAEGVETQAQLTFLRSKLCDEIQGNYFSPPLSAPEMGDLLRSNFNQIAECR